jgi:glycosyltransferase involved in cell wall biosynthesis
LPAFGSRLAERIAEVSRRILHVVPSLAPRYGGPSAATAGMCRALGEAGISTLIVTTDADGRGRLDVATGTVETYAGVPVIFFPRQMSESFKWSWPLAVWLGEHVGDFDLVHVHAVFSHASIMAGRACRRRGVPYIVRPLGTLDPWSLRRHPLRKKILLHMAARSLLAGASLIHYTSDEEHRLATQQLPWLPRGVVVPLGVDAALFDEPAGPRRQEPYVLAMSRLDEKKGLELIIDAFHDVARDGCVDGWRMVIAGDGDRRYVERLRAMAAAGPARDRIAFTGWLAGAARDATLEGAGLFALPSHQENFGIAMVEAMACGIPVMVSPGVNLGTDIEAAGAGWVVPRNRAAWRDQLTSAMADDEGREQRGGNARRFAERFRWPAIAGLLQSMYEEVAGTRCAA